MVELTPVAIENHIRELSARISKSVIVCNQRYGELLEAERAFSKSFASAYLAYEGPQAEKRYHADIASMGAREVRDIADQTYRYADRLAKALQSELMAFQSLNKSVLAQFDVAGVGER
ncbi:hypothetical protein [Brevibacterium paucivorans]|uniref:hypothetical protein n=1 Tax=Brevibacterium paucivorans TaxID=170994 RepID=UPI00321B28FF